MKNMGTSIVASRVSGTVVVEARHRADLSACPPRVTMEMAVNTAVQLQHPGAHPQHLVLVSFSKCHTTPNILIDYSFEAFVFPRCARYRRHPSLKQ